MIRPGDMAALFQVQKGESASLFDAIVHFVESTLFFGVALYVHVMTPQPVHIFRKIGVDMPELTLAFGSIGFRVFLLGSGGALFAAFLFLWLSGRRRAGRVLALANLTCGVIVATLWLVGILLPLDAAIERLRNMSG